ncbi:MAG TPA: hypothetical protein VJB57_10435 [Dehalococcoidia bacterium]|nr:hypothetical protein [Dehalococcoidia bacterium]
MATNLGSSPLVRSSFKSFTFTGAAGFGAIGNCTIFTVTAGIHVVSIDAFILTSLGVDGGTGAASLSLGTTGTTTLFVAATTATALLSTTPLWYSATPNTNGIALPAAMKDIAIQQNIVAAVTSSGTQLINAGVLEVTITWLPISSTSVVV